MTAICDADPDCFRKVVRITGADRHSFLQGLVTNDVSEGRHGLVYAALLSPQGKYLADFFVQSQGAEIWLDVYTNDPNCWISLWLCFNGYG